MQSWLKFIEVPANVTFFTLFYREQLVYDVDSLIVIIKIDENCERGIVYTCHFLKIKF